MFNRMVEQSSSTRSGLRRADRSDPPRDAAPAWPAASHRRRTGRAVRHVVRRRREAREGAGTGRVAAAARSRAARIVADIDAGPLAAADRWLAYYERFWSMRLDDLERALPILEKESHMNGISRSSCRRPRSASNGCCPARSRLSGPISPMPRSAANGWRAGRWSRGSAARSPCASSIPTSRHTRRRRRRSIGRWTSRAISAEETITVFEPPHRLAFTWGGTVRSDVRAVTARGRQGAADPDASQATQRRRAQSALRAAGIAISPSWPKSSKAGLRRPSGMSFERSMRNTLHIPPA